MTTAQKEMFLNMTGGILLRRKLGTVATMSDCEVQNPGRAIRWLSRSPILPASNEKPNAIDGFRGVGDVAMSREIEGMGPRKQEMRLIFFGS